MADEKGVTIIGPATVCAHQTINKEDTAECECSIHFKTAVNDTYD